MKKINIVLIAMLGNISPLFLNVTIILPLKNAFIIFSIGIVVKSGVVELIIDCMFRKLS